MADHREHHFRSSETIRDVVIGMSDGLTVPFALAAGLSGAVASTGLVVVAGLAEIAAGSIAMGLGGYLAARTDAEHYAAERMREEREVEELPALEAREVQDILGTYGVPAEAAQPVVDALKKNPRNWVDFMMRFELELSEPDPRRALTSAVTIALAYIVGGFIPLTPYIFMHEPVAALRISVTVTITSLFVFGFIKGRFTGARPLRSGFQTTTIGGLAAAAAYLLAKAIS